MVHHKHAPDTRKPYSGLSRSLVIAIDVGTTFSGVSYAILEPGEIPKIHGVTRFPGQEHVAGNSKIQSVIYYDKYGNVMAAGAEADNSSFIAQAEDEGWIKAELFKLRLRPRTMQLNMNGMRLAPLPKRKTPVHVFGDFLTYMYRCTRIFICDTHANGKALWNSVEADIQFVLSHPNGWEGPQQTRMRNAAVYGKLVPDTDEGRARIRFVTEGEASLHACVLSGLAVDVLSNPSKHGFLICDAGGGTLDISAYAIKGTSPLTMEEIAPPDCIFAGSIFVSRRAREFLEEKLKDSKYGTVDSVEHITRKFDETTKRLFRDRNELQFIPFGSPLDKDTAVGIRSGQLRLSGNEVANLFEPSVDAAVNAIKRQIEASNGIIRSVFLVGGYAASPWLFGQLQERLAPLRVTVSRPDTQTSKAVADGAIGFYCDHHVSARMSKFMYGVEFLRELDPSDPDHMARKDKLCELPSGPKLLPDAFDCILARSIKVKESTVFTRKYSTELTNLSMLSVFEVEIWCFRGGNSIPKWINRQDPNFSTLCVVQADLSLLQNSAETKTGRNGKKYWTIIFSVEIHFGLTEFKARIKWMDNGQVRYGPAVIVYNERGHRMEDEDLDMYPEDDLTFTSRSDRNKHSNRASPSSRPRTPIDANYPPAPTAAVSSRRASNAGVPDVTPIERSSSKGYAPSVAPSASGKSNVDRGTYSGSDSDRRKGEDRETKYDATPVDRTKSATGSAYGASPKGSNAGGDAYASTWGAPAGSTHSPSVRPPNSTHTSFYGDVPGSATGGEHVPVDQGWGANPASAIDDQHHGHSWDNQAVHQSPQSARLDAILDRPRSPFPQSQEPDQHAGSRPRSPYMPDQHQQAAQEFGRSASPFTVERPKSSIGGAALFGVDKPRSAYGDGPPPSIFGNDHPPAMFGDSGPAADAGAGGGSTSLFGEPPASVFGDTAATGENSNATDGWGFGTSATPATTPGKKGKKKGSATGTPASGLASRTSPGFGAKPVFGEEPAATSTTGGGLWGSKVPSPYDKGKPLSPLNPATQVDNEPALETAPQANIDSWGFGTSNNAGGTSGWGFDANATEVKVPSRAPSPIPPPQPEEPATPAEETTTVAGKKKKKKGAVAATPVKNSFSWGGEDEEQKANEGREKEEKEAREKEEKEAREKEEKDKQEQDRQEEEERKAEEARLAEEESKRKEEEKSAAGLFGNTPSFISGGLNSSSSLNPPDKPWLSADTGGGDDSWGNTGWGSTTATTTSKKKKTKLGGNPISSSQPSAFAGTSFGSSWGFSGALGGSDPVDPSAPAPKTSPKPAVHELSSAEPASNLFDFGSSAPQLGFSFGDPLSTTMGTTEEIPIDSGNVVAEGGEANGADEDAGGEETSGKKKKKKKKGAAAETTDDVQATPAVEDPPAETPAAEQVPEAEVEQTMTAVGGKKKKKKK